MSRSHEGLTFFCKTQGSSLPPWPGGPLARACPLSRGVAEVTTTAGDNFLCRLHPCWGQQSSENWGLLMSGDCRTSYTPIGSAEMGWGWWEVTPISQTRRPRALTRGTRAAHPRPFPFTAGQMVAWTPCSGGGACRDHQVGGMRGIHRVPEPLAMAWPSPGCHSHFWGVNQQM